jgi:steroid 5-alpha reductase family enzyme
MKEKSPKLHPLLKEQSSKVINAVGPTTAVILSMFLKSGELTLPAVYVLALLGSSAGFYLFLYFITIGYAFGILVPLLVGIYIYSERRLSHLTSAHGSLAILWSIRSASFFLWREYVNWPQLHEKVVEVNQMARFSSKVFCWFVYSFFYLCMVSPFIFRLRSESAWGVLGKVGLVVQATGFLLETIADYQKSAFKSRPGNRNQWCNAGLFAVSTFPNYLGESMFWTGAYVAGIGSYKKPQEWVMATTGLLFISIVVRGAIFSLGAKHRRKYGDNPDFAQFQESHNILGPKLFTKRENIITRSFSEVAS